MTQYTKTESGTRLGLTVVPLSEGTYVLVTTKTHVLGYYALERFGEHPLTPSGRLTRRAMRAFARSLEARIPV